MNEILSKIVIRPILDSDSLEELTLLLNKSYKKLADQGFRFLASHQDVSKTKERIENAECYVAILENKLVGTICYYSPSLYDNHEYFGQPTVAHFGQFAVEPSLQKTGIGSMLMDFIESCAIRDKAKEIGMDTAEGAKDLIGYYEKRGYVFVSYTQWDVTNYRSVIMAKKLTASDR